jgi:DNA uptake protein ComE-like DNA-binding protein
LRPAVLGRRQAAGLVVALALLGAGRLVRQALLVGPDGAWRQELWLDDLLAADPDAAPGGPASAAAAVPAPAARPAAAPDSTAPVGDAADVPAARPRPARGARGSGAAKGPPTPLDPNTAPLDSLQLLPGVGPVLAARIAAAREGGAVFRQPSDLLAIKGIGPASLARLAPFLRFAGRRDAAPAATPDDDNRH